MVTVVKIIIERQIEGVAARPTSILSISHNTITEVPY